MAVAHRTRAALEIQISACWSECHVRFITLLMLAGCQVAPPVRIENEAFDVLEEVRASIGADSLFNERDGRTFHGTRFIVSDVAETPIGPLTFSVRPSGAFLLSVGERTRCFDGTDSWSRDRSTGLVRHLSLGARENMLTSGWLRGMLWLTPGSEHFRVLVDREASTALVLKLTLERTDQPHVASVEIDRATMKPRAFEQSRFGRLTRVEFSEWEEDSGVWLPGALHEFHDGRLRYVDRFERWTAGTPSSFAAPLSKAVDTQFVARGDVECRMDGGGRFYLHASVAGTEASVSGWMLLDTGFGSHALSPDAANRAALGSNGTAQLAGVSGGGASNWRTAKALTVGRLTVDGPGFASVATDALTARAGFDVIGVLGAPLFERAVVTMDARSNTVEIYDPNAFRAQSTRWQSFVIDGTAPCVRGTIQEGTTTTPGLWFRLDTGSDDCLTVSKWAVDAFDLAPERSELRPTKLEGLFGEVLGWRRRLNRLRFAGMMLRSPEVTLLRGTPPGPLSDPWIAGNLGVRALRGRRLTIDMSRRRLSIEPSD